jgi:hypothetical protein
VLVCIDDEFITEQIKGALTVLLKIKLLGYNK